jgi:hypothetical protein
MKIKKAKTRKTEDVNQTKCLINTHGWQWMRGHFDRLPQTMRQRLASSPFNLCPACLEIEVLPKVQAKRRGLSRERALFAATEVMESEVRKGK